ncbi:MAG: NAD-dependent epimerase/dehydratase family protein [Pseudanabaenales cyanobacterium]|nr:NAD-dependent epimerase/dehydratase family protein [Pseudanabaenales cyanobacterium]
MSTQTILVTGATGFIGSHLLPALQNTGCPITVALRNHFHHAPDTTLQTVKVGDIHGATDWQPALKNIHTVIHLAARAHQIHDTAADPEKAFWEVNTAGAANLVKQSIDAGVQHFVFISSIGAMATLSPQILTEASPCHPDTPYGHSKLAAEQALIELAQNSPMTWTILRPTLVYGSGNPGNMERLMKLIKTGLPLPFGAIQNRRSFLYVGNLVDIILRTLTHPKAQNQTFICSDGQDLSTPELIQLICRCTEQPCRLIPIPLPLLRLSGKLGDAAQQLSGRSLSLNSETLERLTGSLAVDINKLQNQLNWQPPYAIEVGLKTLFD